jgi:hypothetical protein
LGIAIYSGRKRKKEGEEKENLKQPLLKKEAIMETKKMRTIVVVTMLLCFGMVTALVIPSSAMAKESTVKIGLVMEPQTLNPLSAESEQNWHIIEMIYCGGYMAPRGGFMHMPLSH